MSQLEALKMHSVVVADTADFGLLASYHPEDATTNPSLILAVTKQGEDAQAKLKAAAEFAAAKSTNKAERLTWALDKLIVLYGLEILSKIPGRVSTEVDAKLSFDADATVKRARRIITLYEEAGISRERVYIKIAATWQGIQAARVLESEGICCNLTLLFSFAQAVGCAQAGVSLISPFVGRITDWYKAHDGVQSYEASKDPGVQRVGRIYRYYKAHGYKTIVMGASFRNVDQVLALAGCDKITISPGLLQILNKTKGDVPRQLSTAQGEVGEQKLETLSEAQFHYMHNTDAMAIEKLSDGIRVFDAHARAVEDLLCRQF